MLKARALIVAGALAALWSAPALACSYGGNEYEYLQRRPIEELVTRAAMIERVHVEQPTEAPCEAEPAREATQAERDAWRDRLSPGCRRTGLPGIRLQGTVVERFVGYGPASIDLVWRASNGSSLYFSDFAQVYERVRPYVERYDARRQELHLRRAFWMDHGIGFPVDGSDSCGGDPVLTPGSEYVLFRDAGGATIAAEPVTGPDDPLVQWLRLPVESRARLERTLFTPEQAFRVATGLVEVQLTRCEPADPRLNDWPHVLYGRQLRGRDVDLSYDGDAREQEVELLRLDAWIAWRNLSCEPMRLLVVATNDGGGWLPPMPAVITDGTVSVAELFRGVRLTGPERVTVDQAFEWFEAGRAEE